MQRPNCPSGDTDVQAMLEVVGLASLSLGDLHARTVPGAILLTAALNLPPPVDQAAMLAELRALTEADDTP